MDEQLKEINETLKQILELQKESFKDMHKELRAIKVYIAQMSAGK